MDTNDYDTLVTTVAGSGSPGFVNGTGKSSSFNFPRELTINPTTGDLYIIDSGNHAIRCVNQKGQVTSLLPTVPPKQVHTSSTILKSPAGIALDNSGETPILYISEYHTHRILKTKAIPATTPENESVAPGEYFGGKTAGYADGPVSEALFRYPKSLSLQRNSIDNKPIALFLIDFGNRKFRKVLFPQEEVQTIQEIVVSEEVKGEYSPIIKLSSFSWDMCVDNNGTIYIADSGAHQIKKVANGVMSVIAGEGNPGFFDGASGRSKFHYPTGITIDENTGNLYICDTYNHRIRKITTRGEVFTIAGSSIKGFSEGFGVKQSQFSSPTGIVFYQDALWVADSGNHRIRKICFPVEQLSKILSQDLSKLQNNTDLSDLLIYAEDKIFRLHKSIALARCPKLLEFDGTKIPSISKGIFTHIVNYLYTDQISMETFSIDQLFEILSFCDNFSVKFLSVICQYYILQLTSIPTIVPILTHVEAMKSTISKHLLDNIIWFVIVNWSAFGEKEVAQLALISTFAAQIVAGILPLKSPPTPIIYTEHSLMKEMTNLYENQNVNGSDLTILLSSSHFDDKKLILRVHKNILITRSGYFHSLLKDFKGTVLQLKTEMPVDVFKSFLRLIYSGNILSLSPVDCLWILAEGHKYKITIEPKIYEYCNSIITTELKSTNCIEIFQVSSHLNLTEHKMEATRVILNNQKILETRLRMLPENVKKDLKDSQLLVSQQQQVDVVMDNRE